MKAIICTFIGLFAFCVLMFLVVGYDSVHPRVTTKRQEYTVQFSIIEKIDEAIIMMALPTKNIKRDTLQGVKRQVKKYRSAIEMKRVNGNTFTFYLSAKKEKYNLLPDKIYDEFAVAIILLLKTKTGGCTLDIIKNKSKYIITRNNIKFKKRVNSNKTGRTN
jgi:hypothetical protein